MKILVWDGQNQITESFLDMAQKYADIDLFEDPLELAASAVSGDIIVFDLDANPKLVERTLKKIKKESVNATLVVLTNNLASKAMAKHQKSKHGADIYLRSPVDEKLFIKMIRPLVGDQKSFGDEIEKEQARTIISEHQTSEVAAEDPHTQSTNAQLDEVFREAMGDDGESTRALEEIRQLEIEENGENELKLDEGEDDLMDLGEDDLHSEELDMSENDSKKPDENALDLDDGIGLELGDDEELSLDSLEGTASEEAPIDEGDLLDLDGDDAGELSLGDEEPETFDLGPDDDGLSLDSEEDVPLEIDEDTQAKEFAANDGLELGEENSVEDISSELSLGEDDELQYDDDNSKMFDLDAVEEDSAEPDDLSLSEEPAQGLEEKSLEEELNLTGEENTLDDAELFGSPKSEEDDSGLSSESLPDSPGLEAPAKANSEMSQHALEQLAQIDEVMKRDASQIRKGLKPDETREINLNEVQQGAQEEAKVPDLNAQEESNDLVAQLHAETEEEDYDPTAGQDEGAEGLFTSSSEVTSTAIKTTSPITTTEPEASSHDPHAEQTIKEQKSALMRHEDELMRLGATIKGLREDREDLTRQIEVIRENGDSEKRDYEGLRAQLDEKRIELEVSRKRASKQAEEMRYRIELSEDKSRALEEKVKRLEVENEKLRGKANIDVTRVRARERELENKLELLRADTETQIRNRDTKILELKRKIDTLEFDIESIQHKEQKTVDNNFAMEERMDRVINTLRRAIGELESEDAPIRNLEALKKNLDV